MKKQYNRIIVAIILMIYMLSMSTAFAVNKVPKNGIKNNIIIKKVVTTSNIVAFTQLKKTVTSPKEQVNSSNVNANKSTVKTQVVEKVSKVAAYDQFALPSRGDVIALITTTVGEIRIKLLTEVAPNTVNAFKKRINEGYYNGLSIYKIIPNSVIQGGTVPQGSPDSGNGTLNESNSQVRNFRGAVSSVVGDSAGKLDQFTIVQGDASNIANDTLSYMTTAADKNGNKLFPKDVLNKYKKVGGAPWLDTHNVVFGQVINSQKQGMKTIDKISKVSIDENNKPKKNIKIIKIELVNYK